MGLSQRGRAWLALAGPALAWFVFQQGLGWVLHVACDAAWVGIVWGLVSLALSGAALWPTRQLARADGGTTHPWLARMAMLGGCVFALAITFQTLAVAMVPPCAR